MSKTQRAPDPVVRLKAFLAEHGLKSTRQREVIARVFFESEGHLRVEEIFERVRRLEPRVSQATVYRTVKLLKETGLAEERRFADGQARYEPADRGEEHHDHLICIECGRIVEFVDPRIERLQEEVAGGYGFSVTGHRLDLYGRCDDCRGGS